MVIYTEDSKRLTVPGWVVDLDSFRQWVDTDAFPDEGRIWWLNGEVWIDMSKEQVFTHLLMKQEVNLVLGGLVKTGQLGLYLPDGLFLSNFDGNFAGNPDATFLSTDTLQSDRIRLIEGKEAGYVEVQGQPDMVVEVVSDSSVQKDTVLLRKAYWDAGIPEYWLIDVRNERLEFDILRHTAKGYVSTRKQSGWIKSAVFGKAFRLTRQTNALGHPEFTLAVR
jgi:Putative restriction endonuclease